MTRELMEQVDWCRYVVGGEPNSVIGVGHLHHPAYVAQKTDAGSGYGYYPV